MIAVISIGSLAGGTAVSCLSDRLPMRRGGAELLGGLLLVIGLALIGFGVSPLFR